MFYPLKMVIFHSFFVCLPGRVTTPTGWPHHPSHPSSCCWEPDRSASSAFRAWWDHSGFQSQRELGKPIRDIYVGIDGIDISYGYLCLLVGRWISMSMFIGCSCVYPFQPWIKRTSAGIAAESTKSSKDCKDNMVPNISQRWILSPT